MKRIKLFMHACNLCNQLLKWGLSQKIADVRRVSFDLFLAKNWTFRVVFFDWDDNKG
jgi:hypothetical protein